MRKIITVLLIIFWGLTAKAQNRVVRRSGKGTASIKVIQSKKANLIPKKKNQEEKVLTPSNSSQPGQVQTYQPPVKPQYSFGTYKIDRDLYIRNLRDNVYDYTENKRNYYGWTNMQIREFQEAYNDFVSAMGEGRLSTDEFGSIIDSKGLLSNKDKFDYWYDKHGNCITNDEYNLLKDKKKKKYEQFNANQQFASFAYKVGKALIEALRQNHEL